MTATTATRGTRLIGVAALVALGWQALFGLVLSPDDAEQGAAVRFFYLHVPSVMVAYLGFVLCAVGSVQYLRRGTSGWDRLAGASAEIGLLFMAICLLTGALWGKRTWGVYWTWDARLTSSALLFMMFLGYVAVRGLEASPQVRAKRSAIVGLIAAANVPIVHKSVDWWRSLHQKSTLAKPDPDIDGLMLFSMFVGLVAFLLVFAWMMLHRTRAMALEEIAEHSSLDAAIAQRVAEGAAH